MKKAILLLIFFFLFSFSTTQNAYAASCAPANIPSNPILIGKEYKINATGLKPNTIYRLVVGTSDRIPFNKNSQTDANGTLRDATFTIITSLGIKTGSHLLTLENYLDSNDFCSLVTVTLQAPLSGTTGYLYNNAAKACFTCTFGKEADCNYIDKDSCDAFAGYQTTPTPPSPSSSPAPTGPPPPCNQWRDLSGNIITDPNVINNPNIPKQCSQIKTAIGDVETDPREFIRKLFAVLLSLGGGITLYFFITSGYRLMVSQGNAEAIQGAKDRITSSIIGLLFMVFSLVMLQIIGVDIFHIPGFGK